MLPPPASRQSSYAYQLPHPSPHNRIASFASATGRSQRASSSRPRDGESDAEDSGRSEGSNSDNGDFEERLGLEEDLEGLNEERGLEETLEKLGFGAYHWRLLALCGFGWMSDNSALQCIAVILPRVKVHFDLTSEVVALLSASTMAGMMIGAVGWGTVSDLLGRALPFNVTLFLTAVFGIGASFAPTFPVLLVWMFLLGSAVGGSMPTDGTLFLENLPHSKQYLLTLLSVFFSLGAVLSSVISLIFLPGSSCKQFEGCDIAGKQNDGWRRVLFVLGIFNLLCSFARWGLFRLHESPRYLVSNGREQEAVMVLQAIATYNDQTMDIQAADVQSTEHGAQTTVDDTLGKTVELASPLEDLRQNGSRGGERSPLPVYSPTGPGTGDTSPTSSARTKYAAVSVGTPAPLRKHPVRTESAFYAETPASFGVENERANEFERSFSQHPPTSVPIAEAIVPTQSDDEVGLLNEHGRLDTERITRGGVKGRARKPAGPFAWWHTWMRQLKKLFAPQWRRTVILMWIIWASMSFAYTMFNVWLPAVLESRASGEGDDAIKQALREYVLYSLAGCPGSIAGAWMIQTKLGRRKSLAICTAATGLSTFAFISVKANWAVIVSSMVISAAATAMYAVLYGMTPETFGTSIRGTACGTSAALSRLAGVMAPVSAGVLLTISPSLPVFVAAGVFLATAACSLLLPFERVAEGGKGGMSFAH